MTCSIMHMLLDSHVFEWRRSCLLTCDFEGKCRKKKRNKKQEEESTGEDTINCGMTKFIHPFPVNYHLFLIMVTGRCSLSLGERQKHSLDSLSGLHKLGNILQYKCSIHNTAKNFKQTNNLKVLNMFVNF